MIAWFVNMTWVEKVGWSVLAAILLGVVLVLISAGLRKILEKYLEWQNVQTLEVQERVGLKIEFIKTAAQILGGAFFLLTLVFTWQNLQLTAKKNADDLKMAQEKQITDLYVKAIEQLGRPTLEERLGGIYALERIAEDSDKYHGPIIEVLTAYVRANSPWPPPKDFEAVKEKRPWAQKRPGDILKEKGLLTDKRSGEELFRAIEAVLNEVPEPEADIQAVLTVLGRRSRTFRERGSFQRLDLTNADLRLANITGAHLEDAKLWGTRLEGAWLIGTNLEGADLHGARLRGAWLIGTNLERAKLMGAEMQGAKLEETLLERAVLWEAHLEGASLRHANLKGASLRDVHLERADLFEAQLEWANLNGAHLEGADLQEADFREAHGLKKDQLILARCWFLAFFETKLLKELGLPPDHNERLQRRDLIGYNLEGADLRKAMLIRFNLQQANLKEAHLEGASMTGATLREAHLEGADLSGVDLSEAIGLTQDQIDSAYCDEKTKLPPGLKYSGKKNSLP